MAPLRTLVLPAFAAIAAAASISDYVPACGTSCIADTVDASTTCEADDGACICAQTYTVKRNAEVCLRNGCSDSDYGNVMSGYDKFCAEVGDEPSPTSSGTTTSEAPSSTTSGYETSAPPATTSSSGYETSAPPATTSSGYETSAPPATTTSSGYETTEVPTTTSSGYETSAPPSSYPTSSEVPSSYPTTLTTSPTSIIETFSTDVPSTYPTTVPPPATTDYPTTAGPAPTPSSNATVSTGYPTSAAPSGTPSGEPTIVPVPGAGARSELNAAIYLGAALLAGGLAVFGF